MECNDIDYITFTNIQKIHSTFLNSNVSKGIRNVGDTYFVWAFAISTMLRQSLNLFIENFINLKLAEEIVKKNEALAKLNRDDFHRQLRNELIMIPIPKYFSNDYNDSDPMSQGHYVRMAFERVSPM